MEQGQISGIVNFLSYDNYYSLVDFIESSENLKFAYKIPFQDGSKEYFKDIQIQSFSKTQKNINGIISETITFDCLSLWYEENTIIYTIEPQGNEIRWDFRWDSRFSDYNSRSLQYINRGHIEAPIYVEIDGHVLNPKLELYVEGQLYQTITVNVDIKEYEKFIYNTRENEFAVARQNLDGTIGDLFSMDYIDPQNDNVMRIPKNRSCEVKITADNAITNAKLTIYPRYKAI